MERTRSDELQFVGRVASHYCILEQIGEGGMGVVYVAEDMRVGRRAELKFLPRKLMSDDDRFDQPHSLTDYAFTHDSGNIH